MFKAFDFLKVHDRIAKKLGVEVPDGSGFWYVLKAISFNGKFIIPGKPQKSFDDLKKLAIRFTEFLPKHLEGQYGFDPHELDRLKTEIAGLKEEFAQQKDNKPDAIRIAKIALFVSIAGVGLQAAGLGFDIYKSSDFKPNKLKDLQLNTIQDVRNYLLGQITIHVQYFLSTLSSTEYGFYVRIDNNSSYDLKILSIDHYVDEWGIERHINQFKFVKNQDTIVKAKKSSSFHDTFADERLVTTVFTKYLIRDWLEENEQFISVTLFPTNPEELFAATGAFSYKQLSQDHRKEIPLKLQKIYQIGKISGLPDGDGE